MKEKLFTRDFTLVVIGQIISLFGNAAIRFVLPLYLLNETGSSALYGTVTACAFLPAILLSPVGGMVADRVNKRNIMVALDFFTTAVIGIFSAFYDTADLIALITVTLMLLYGIAGAYQPSVQASIPALVSRENFMQANSAVNIINSFSSLMGPVLGGILYSTYGLMPVLWVCIVCFFLSAVMETFIRIPLTEQDVNRRISEGNRSEKGSTCRQICGGIWRTVREDFSKSLRFIRKEEPVIGKVLFMICGINLFLSAMLTVGLPYIITEVLPIEPGLANRLCGYAEGALAAGGLAGGVCAGVFAKKLTIRKAGNLIIGCAACVFPMGIAMILSSPAMAIYLVIMISCFFMMICSTVFMVQMMSFVQTETPQNLIGKVIAVILTISMGAQPVGNAMYGVLFKVCRGFEYVVVLLAGVASLSIALAAGRILKKYMAMAPDD